MRYWMGAWKLLLITLVIPVFSHMLVSVCHADSATVLPKGSYQLLQETAFFFDVTEAYDDNGNRQDLATPFNVPLCSVLTCPPGVDLGTNAFDIKFQRNDILWTPAYGLTDRLSVGVRIPTVNTTSLFGRLVQIKFLRAVL